MLLFLAALSYIASMLLFWKFSFLKYVVLASTVVWIGECLEAFGRINIFSGLGNIFLLPKSFWNNYCNLWFTCIISEAWINFIFILANHFAMLKIAWTQRLFKAVALCCAQLHSCNCKYWIQLQGYNGYNFVWLTSRLLVGNWLDFCMSYLQKLSLFIQEMSFKQISYKQSISTAVMLLQQDLRTIL